MCRMTVLVVLPAVTVSDQSLGSLLHCPFWIDLDSRSLFREGWFSLRPPSGVGLPRNINQGRSPSFSLSSPLRLRTFPMYGSPVPRPIPRNDLLSMTLTYRPSNPVLGILDPRKRSFRPSSHTHVTRTHVTHSSSLRLFRFYHP